MAIRISGEAGLRSAPSLLNAGRARALARSAEHFLMGDVVGAKAENCCVRQLTLRSVIATALSGTLTAGLAQGMKIPGETATGQH